MLEIKKLKKKKHRLQWLLSRVNHTVHSQVVGALEGTSTELTYVVPLV